MPDPIRLPDPIRFALVPLHPLGIPGSVEWDPQAGTLTGAGADELIAAAEAAVEFGCTSVGCMGPVYYPISDPLHRHDEMAALVSSEWHVPPELAPYMPKYDFPPLPEGVTA